jgi:thiol-disulfide isomerase/thioredoxin
MRKILSLSIIFILLCSSVYSEQRELLIFSEPRWCPPCRKLEAELKTEQVKQELKNYVVWNMDEKSYADWNVTGLPTIIIVERNQLIGTIEIKRQKGFSGNILKFLGDK